MNISTDFVNIYKENLKKINEYNRIVRHIEHLRKRVERKQIIATEEVVALIEKEHLELEDEYSCKKDKIYNFSNGDKYIGKIEKNELQGIGTYIMYDGEEIIMDYMGEFNNNIRDGVGECILPNGNIYLGEFKEDLMNGIGKMIYKNGDEYIGQWINGKKDGIGVFTWSDNTRYNGEFKENKMCGQGQCFDQQGNLIYEGQWKNNCIHGFGKYIWGEGKVYEGEFIRGKKHGKGTFYLNDELIYEGTWKFDKPSVFGRSLEELFCVKI